MTPKEFIDKEHFNLTLDCPFEIPQIYKALQDYAGLKDKKIKDLLNWVKSDLEKETSGKIGKTSTPYRTEKIRFLNIIIDRLKKTR